MSVYELWPCALLNYSIVLTTIPRCAKPPFAALRWHFLAYLQFVAIIWKHLDCRDFTSSSNGNTFSCYWPFVRGIHRSPVNFPHNGQWRGALIFSVICAWINGWVNNREAGDLRRHRVHFDVILIRTFELTSLCIAIILWIWWTTGFTLTKVEIFGAAPDECLVRFRVQ